MPIIRNVTVRLQSNSNFHTVHTVTVRLQSNSNFHTVHTARIPAPHNHSQHNQCRTPYAVVHCLVLLMMGIMMAETCWDRSLIINIRLVASCWFLSLHPTFMMHSHKSLKHNMHVPQHDKKLISMQTLCKHSGLFSNTQSDFTNYLTMTINCQNWLLCFNATKYHGPLTNVKYSLVLSFLIL